MLVLRARQPGEVVTHDKVAFSLPGHMCCDVHVFVSGDKVHDAGLACMATGMPFQQLSITN